MGTLSFDSMQQIVQRQLQLQRQLRQRMALAAK